jgi:hypothetical protein
VSTLLSIIDCNLLISDVESYFNMKKKKRENYGWCGAVDLEVMS